MRANGFLIILDEAHLIEKPRVILEALIKRCLYVHRDRPVSVIVATSEGHFVLSDEVRILKSYGAVDILIDHLDYEHFKAFTEEYVELKSIALEVSVDELYYELCGGIPGAFIALTSQGVKRWIKDRRVELLRAISLIAKELKVKREAILEFIAQLPIKIDPSDLTSQPTLISQRLMIENIVFYDPSELPSIVKPQMPIYVKLAEST